MLFRSFSIEDICQKIQPDIILFNSVLQYLETPFAFVETAQKHNISAIFIGRTPTFEGEKDRITQQIVPPKIYKASYPSWVFSINYFEKQLIKNTGYTINWSLNTPYSIHKINRKQLFLSDVFLIKK